MAGADVVMAIRNRAKGEAAIEIIRAAAVDQCGRSIPQLSKELICKDLTDLKRIGALEE